MTSTYAYDGVGNRTSSQRSATYSYQPFNRLTNTTTASYLYNNNGNMISKSDASGTTQFAWDFENRLTQVVTPTSGSVTYKYDALDRRVQSAPSNGVSTNFTYDGDDVAQDKTSTNVITEYLNGPGIDNKIRQKTGNTVYYFARDHLGSTTALTSSNGALAERETYDAYGNNAGSTKTRYGFTGRERDSLTGLLYYRARFYDPQLGRFISEDPIGLFGGINPFVYVENNPLFFTDPSGLCPEEKKCRQDKNGGDRPDIEDLLRRAGVSGNISNIRSAGPKSPEGILFHINNAQAFIALIRSSRHFTQDIPTEHLSQVGGNLRNTYGFRSYTDSKDGLGPDSTGFIRSLQIAVGPPGSADPNDPNTARGYADLDCANPDQDVVSFFKHNIPIIGRRIGGWFH